MGPLFDTKRCGRISLSEIDTHLVRPSSLGVDDALLRVSITVLKERPLRGGFAGGDPGIPPFRSVLEKTRNLLPDVSEAWIHNHYVQIVWKLASYLPLAGSLKDAEVSLPRPTVDEVVRQLRYRCEREVNQSERSVLKRACERDGPANCRMVVFVSRLDLKSDGGLLAKNVSDGWYTVKARFDPYIDSLVRSRRLQVGSKLFVSNGAMVTANGVPCEATDVLEAQGGAVYLQLHGNSTKPAPWHERLGRCAPGRPMYTALERVRATGGLAGIIPVIIVYRYPLQYVVEDSEKNQHVYTGDHAFERGQLQLAASRSDDFRVRMNIKFKCIPYPRGNSIHPRSQGARLDALVVGIVTWYGASADLLEALSPGNAVCLVGMHAIDKRCSTDGLEKHLKSSRASTIWPVERAPRLPQISHKEFSNPPQIKTRRDSKCLREDQECNLLGFLLHVSTKHYWILPMAENGMETGDDANIGSLVAVEINRRKAPLPDCLARTCREDKPPFHRVIEFRNVVFQYEDPKHSFVVMLEGDFTVLQMINGRSASEDGSLTRIFDELIPKIRALTE
jgi:hypothetical protein